MLVHAYKEMIKLNSTFEIVVLLFANNPAISIELIKKGINKLIEDETYDSAFSVSKYNMFSPTRARKLENDKIKSFIPLDLIGNVSSIRSSQRRIFL